MEVFYMNLYEKTLSEEIVYTGDYLTFTKVKVQLPDGNEANRDIIKHPGACGIIPFCEWKSHNLNKTI